MIKMTMVSKNISDQVSTTIGEVVVTQTNMFFEVSNIKRCGVTPYEKK